MTRVRLTLFVSGASPRNKRMIITVENALKRFLKAGFQLSVVDLSDAGNRRLHPDIIATPAIIDESSALKRRVAGDFSDGKTWMRLLELIHESDGK